MIGFNDMPFADQFTPPLTTTRYSYYDMGRNAAEMLMGQINGTGAGPRTLVLSTELVVRGSTAPPADAGDLVRRPLDSALATASSAARPGQRSRPQSWSRRA